MKEDKKEIGLMGEVERAIDAENTTSICYRHLAALVKNGRIRNRFLSLFEKAKANKELLLDCRSRLDAGGFKLENKCKFCKVNPESFFLTGAINLGLEVTSAITKIYRQLLGLSERFEEKRLFKKLLKEKQEQKDFLKKEKQFPHSEEEENHFIDSYCIPRVISEF